jgi:hypothetical protein
VLWRDQVDAADLDHFAMAPLGANTTVTQEEKLEATARLRGTS